MSSMTEALLAQHRIGIVGLGLMGGSLALALRGRCRHLLAIEPQVTVRQTALRKGTVDAVTDDFAAGVAKVDLLVFATPVRTTIELLARLPDLQAGGGVVLDLGSTKQMIIQAMDALPPPFEAIGGHPMCGKELPGLASAAADLYQDQTFVLCRSRRTTPTAEAHALALIAALGARPVFLDAAVHDELVAAVSHLPYLVSAALMRVVAGEQEWAISATGFSGAARLAGSDTRMMLDILMTNRTEVLSALRHYQADLAALESLLAGEDEPGLANWLAEARVRYAAYQRHRSAYLSAPPAGGEGEER